jgi:hypothetical protein
VEYRSVGKTKIDAEHQVVIFITPWVLMTFFTKGLSDGKDRLSFTIKN